MSTSQVWLTKELIQNGGTYPTQHRVLEQLDKNAKWVNFGQGGGSPRFTSSVLRENQTGIFFSEGDCIYNTGTGMSLLFDSTFTISLWARFQKHDYGFEVPGSGSSSFSAPTLTSMNKMLLKMNDGTIYSYSIPSSITLTNWNHYSIVRDGADLITFRINGVTRYSVTSTKVFNVSSNSAFYLGNSIEGTTGNNIEVDDLLLFDGALWTSDSSPNLPPTDYIDLSTFKLCLYIKVSTGEVYGMKRV